MLYNDPAAEIEKALASSALADMESRDEYGVLHRVWKVSDPKVIETVRNKMRDKKLIIADGHHRYERQALNYRNERRAAAGAGSTRRTPPMNFLMMTRS